MAFRYTVAYERVPIDFKEHSKIVDWCRENVGEPRITWSYSAWRWRFRFKRDYTMFLLRWA